ncbi:hypothetical protein D3C86_1994860 [compost metagenome]
MEIFEFFGIVVTEDVFPHHPALCNPWSDNGGGCNQYLVILALQSSQQPPHRRALDVKASYRFTDAQELIAPGFIF